jgi:hypothetical protein
MGHATHVCRRNTRICMYTLFSSKLHASRSSRAACIAVYIYNSSTGQGAGKQRVTDVRWSVLRTRSIYVRAACRHMPARGSKAGHARRRGMHRIASHARRSKEGAVPRGGCSAGSPAPGRFPGGASWTRTDGDAREPGPRLVALECFYIFASLPGST